MAGLMEDLDERLETRGLKEGSHRIATGHWQAFRRWFEVTAGERLRSISDCTLGDLCLYAHFVGKTCSVRTVRVKLWAIRAELAITGAEIDEKATAAESFLYDEGVTVYEAAGGETAKEVPGNEAVCKRDRGGRES